MDTWENVWQCSLVLAQHARGPEFNPQHSKTKRQTKPKNVHQKQFALHFQYRKVTKERFYSFNRTLFSNSNEYTHLNRNTSKSSKTGAGEVARWFRQLAGLQRTQVQFPKPTWQLTSTCNSSSRPTPSSGLQGHRMYIMHRCTCSPNITRIKIQKTRLKFKINKYKQCIEKM